MKSKQVLTFFFFLMRQYTGPQLIFGNNLIMTMNSFKNYFPLSPLRNFKAAC